MKKLKVNKTILVTWILIGSIALWMTGNTFAYNVKPSSASLNTLYNMLSKLTSAVTSNHQQNVSLANQLTAVKTNLQKSNTARKTIKNASVGKIVGTCGPNTVGWIQAWTRLTCKAIEVTNAWYCVMSKSDGERWTQTNYIGYRSSLIPNARVNLTDNECIDGQILKWWVASKFGVHGGWMWATAKGARILASRERVGFTPVYKFE